MENIKKKKNPLLKRPLLVGIVVPILGFLIISIVVGAITFVKPVIWTGFTEENTTIFLSAICRIAFIALVIALTKIRTDGQFKFGFTGRNIKKTFALSTYFFLLIPMAIIMGIVSKSDILQDQISIIVNVILCISVGFYEEGIFRGFILTNCMSRWRGRKNYIFKSLLFSAIVFGLIHLPNILEGKSAWYVILQVLNAGAIGMFFGGVYLRTHNIWPLIIAHAAYDVAALIFVDNGQVSMVDTVIHIIMIILSISFGLYLIRKKKHEEIDALWKDEQEKLNPAE